MDIASLFPVKKNGLYFNFASDGPLPLTTRQAVIDALDENTEKGAIPVHKQMTLFQDIGEELARLFKAKKENFAYIKNTSEGVLLALLALDIREDENYIAAADAFPTTVKLMENLCRGRMRPVKINSDRALVEQVLPLIDGKTRAIVLDWVHFFSGRIIDIAGICALARKKGLFTIIDGIQGAGALGLDLPASGIDFFFSGAHKWLLSPQGTGFIYVADGVWDRVKRKAFGWLGYDWGDFSDFDIKPSLRPGAAVMEYGTRSYHTGVGFLASLRIINGLGIERIEAHNRDLKDCFIEGIKRKGYEVFPDGGRPRAAIVPFKSPHLDVLALHTRLTGQGVKVAVRNGHIRAAFHFINDRPEVERFLALL